MVMGIVMLHAGENWAPNRFLTPGTLGHAHDTHAAGARWEAVFPRSRPLPVGAVRASALSLPG